MRIGLFTDTYSPDINGVVSSIVTLRNQLIRDGHEVFVVTNHPKLFRYSYEDHVLRVTGLEIKFLYGYTMSSPWHLRAFNDIRKMKLDVIHVQTEFGIGIFARICARTLNIPMVSTYHTTYEDYTHYVNVLDLKSVETVSKKAVARLSKLYAQSSMVVIAPSQKTKELLESYNITREIDVIPSGLDLAQFTESADHDAHARQLRESYGFRADNFVFIYLGRVAEEKSIDVVIDCFAKLAQVKPEVRLLIVGSGPNIEDLKQQVWRLNLTDKVVFAGKKQPSEVADHYYSADAFISASLSETQGVTFIEALACGLPIFARPDEPLDDILLEAKTGYAFHDPDEFTEKALAYLNLTMEQRRDFSVACKTAASHYDCETFASAVLLAYERAIAYAKEDYHIEQIELTGSQAVLTLKSPHQIEKIVMTESEMNEKKLKEGMNLTKLEVDDLRNDQAKYRAYVTSIGFLEKKDASVQEIRHYLKDECEMNDDVIDSIVALLLDHKYLDDRRFALEIITRGKDKGYGQNRIKKKLRAHLLDESLIASLDDLFTEAEEFARALQVGRKFDRTIKGKSARGRQVKIYEKLIRNGFSLAVSEQVIEDSSFQTSDRHDLELAIAKGRRLYHDDRQRITEYCVKKGFSYDEIRKQLKEGNEDDED